MPRPPTNIGAISPNRMAMFARLHLSRFETSRLNIFRRQPCAPGDDCMFHAPYNAASMAVQAYQKLISSPDVRLDRAVFANVVKPNYPCSRPRTAIGMVPQLLAAADS